MSLSLQELSSKFKSTLGNQKAVASKVYTMKTIPYQEQNMLLLQVGTFKLLPQLYTKEQCAAKITQKANINKND